jgi:hypothetical protein
VNHTVKIRGTHPGAFRSGEWATLLHIEPISVTSGVRDCFVVVFDDDGTIDTWPVEDSGYDYEFKDMS